MKFVIGFCCSRRSFAFYYSHPPFTPFLSSSTLCVLRNEQRFRNLVEHGIVDRKEEADAAKKEEKSKAKEGEPVAMALSQATISIKDLKSMMRRAEVIADQDHDDHADDDQGQEQFFRL